MYLYIPIHELKMEVLLLQFFPDRQYCIQLQIWLSPLIYCWIR